MTSERPTGQVIEARKGAIAVLTLSNPGKLNALTQSMRDALTDAVRRLNQDSECRAIILTGADGHFSAGERRALGKIIVHC